MERRLAELEKTSIAPEPIREGERQATSTASRHARGSSSRSSAEREEQGIQRQRKIQERREREVRSTVTGYATHYRTTLACSHSCVWCFQSLLHNPPSKACSRQVCFGQLRFSGRTMQQHTVQVPARLCGVRLYKPTVQPVRLPRDYSLSFGISSL